MKQQACKKLLSLLCLCLMLLGLTAACFSLPAYAADSSQSYYFELSVDGKESREVKTGDVITVVLHLVRTDADAPYTMYAMQDEIGYDSNFFELVPGSIITADGIQAKDVEKRDSYHELYMNYLSFGGGEQWNERTLIGSFQLQVIGTSGVTKIENRDYLVSLKDGSDSYLSTANQLTVILSTDCTVHFASNGGSAVDDATAIYGELLTKPADPVREGKVFVGWYKDIDLKEEWDFSNDTVSSSMTLYAKWADEAAGGDVVEPPQPTPSGVPVWAIWCGYALVLLLLLLLLLKNELRDK